MIFLNGSFILENNDLLQTKKKINKKLTNIMPVIWRPYICRQYGAVRNIDRNNDKPMVIFVY